MVIFSWMCCCVTAYIVSFSYYLYYVYVWTSKLRLLTWRVRYLVSICYVCRE